MLKQVDKYKILSETARRRGFFWASFEIYGGISGFLDLGPFGTVLRRQIEDAWREYFLRPHGFVEISTPIITPHRVLEASGHVQNFKDPMVECTNCHRKFRADQLVKESTGIETEGMNLEQIDHLITNKTVTCPECGGTLGSSQYFVTMFKTYIGPISGEDPAYGRPEAAQGIFVDFPRVYESNREKFPLGIAQIGTVLRNEISPRQGPIRLREFTIMDFELFFDPEIPECPYLTQVSNEEISVVTELARQSGKTEQVTITVEESLASGVIKTGWMAYFMGLSKRFMRSLGVKDTDQRFFEKLPGERAHYSKQTFDQEVRLDRYGWVEVAGFAYRGDYDLHRHMDATGIDMRVFKPYEVPRETLISKVTINHEKIRQLYGPEAGKIISLLSNENLEELQRRAKESNGTIHVLTYNLPSDIFVTKQEKVKESGRKFVPHVVEPSFGVERLVYATLESNLNMREDRVIISLPFNLAPMQVMVYPLMPRDGLDTKAQEVYHYLLQHGFRTDYDDSGSIGRRYARADEAGVPFCVTVDYDTLKDNTVTLRHRDTWKQVRTGIQGLDTAIHSLVSHGFLSESKITSGHVKTR